MFKIFLKKKKEGEFIKHRGHFACSFRRIFTEALTARPGELAMLHLFTINQLARFRYSRDVTIERIPDGVKFRLNGACWCACVKRSRRKPRRE